MKQRDLINRLIKAGFKRIRSESHFTYSNGKCEVQVPNHKEINEYTAKQILKDAGL